MDRKSEMPFRQLQESVEESHWVWMGFDMLSMGLGMIDSDNPLTALNDKMHSSNLYNAFQVGVNAVATFTGAASATMACFIAGTMVLTATGLVVIEKIKAGDIVISTNPETLETAEKPVLETYVRQVDKLVHLTINGEEIVTTVDHPFYVQSRGFIEAGNLLNGDKLISVNGEDLVIEKFFIEETTEPVDVYNFQVDDYHTYFVGDFAVWVHNAGGYERAQKYSNNWSDESLSKTVDNIAPDSKPVKTSSGKEIYNNPQTGKQVVYDTDGNYFRIEDTNLTGKRVYTDINGNPIPNNKIVNGKQIGISKAEYNQLTHFNNID